MKIAAGIIVLNTDFVLKQVLESMYPHMEQILVSEGAVQFWADRGITTSTDATNQILEEFPDPYNKIQVVHGTYKEKTEQCNAYMKLMHDDIDYMWNVDSDEVFKPDDIAKVKELLEFGQYTSVGFKSQSFFGGFGHTLGGFELDHEFIRIRKVYPGSTWKDHRPPMMQHIAPANEQWEEKHLDFNLLADRYGIYMYHYSYVSPRQVQEKVKYYEAAVISKGNCIEDYFNSVFLPWVEGDEGTRNEIEQKYMGVHEFKPEYRGSCFPQKFIGIHPYVIIRDMEILKKKFDAQLIECKM